jgi:hypothetical protein
MHRHFKLTLAGDGKKAVAPNILWDMRAISGEKVKMYPMHADFQNRLASAA